MVGGWVGKAGGGGRDIDDVDRWWGIKEGGVGGG